MFKLLAIEFGKLLRLTSLRFSLLILAIIPFLWAYAPGIFRLYGYYVVSAYQVPALSLLSSMQFLLPLLVAIASAELLGLEMTFGTLPTILLRPVTRSQWLLAKVIVAALFPLLLLLFFFLMSLLAGAPLGFGAFVGGTGVGAGGLTGEGMLVPGLALLELSRAYLIAALSLLPISLLAILFTILFMSPAGGALATMAVLVLLQLLVVFPWLEPYLLTTQLSAYVSPLESLGKPIILISFYSAVFAALSVVLFERKDF